MYLRREFNLEYVYAVCIICFDQIIKIIERLHTAIECIKTLECQKIDIHTITYDIHIITIFMVTNQIVQIKPMQTSQKD